MLVIVCNNELSFAHKKLIKIVSNMLFILFFSQDKKGDTWKDCNYLKKKKTTCTGSNSKLDKIPKMCMIKCYWLSVCHYLKLAWIAHWQTMMKTNNIVRNTDSLIVSYFRQCFYVCFPKYMQLIIKPNDLCFIICLHSQ